jgi:hypothetical protein
MECRPKKKKRMTWVHEGGDSRKGKGEYNQSNSYACLRIMKPVKNGL